MIYEFRIAYLELPRHKFRLVRNLNSDITTIFRFKIRIGDSNHALDSGDKNAVDLEILKSIVHPDYNTQAVYYDVAILLTENVTFSKFIRPICLPDSPSEDIHKYDHRHVELTGWGKKDLSGPVSERLKRVSIKIFPQR